MSFCYFFLFVFEQKMFRSIILKIVNSNYCNFNCNETQKKLNNKIVKMNQKIKEIQTENGMQIKQVRKQLKSQK